MEFQSWGDNKDPSVILQNPSVHWNIHIHIRAHYTEIKKTERSPSYTFLPWYYTLTVRIRKEQLNIISVRFRDDFTFCGLGSTVMKDTQWEFSPYIIESKCLYVCNKWGEHLFREEWAMRGCYVKHLVICTILRIQTLPK